MCHFTIFAKRTNYHIMRKSFKSSIKSMKVSVKLDMKLHPNKD